MPSPSPDIRTIASVAFPGVYLQMNAHGINAHDPPGIGQLGVGLLAHRLRMLEITADLVFAILETLLDGRKRELREKPEDDHERDRGPEDLLALRHDRVLRLHLPGGLRGQHEC